MNPKLIPNPFSSSLFFMGPPFEQGPLPAFFYFALSGEESLSLSPYNRPVLPLLKNNIRVFSMTIPGHGPGFDKFKALDLWHKCALEDKDFLLPFFDEAQAAIHWLIHEKWVDRQHIAFGGLSRGVFIATHLAAREKNAHTLLGFAPLTTLKTVKEFKEESDDFLKEIEELDLKNLIPELFHIKHLRFYIGNRDERVSTDACYFFIREFAEIAHQNKLRHHSIELRINQAIGFQGHGTSQEAFDEGAAWVNQLLRSKAA